VKARPLLSALAARLDGLAMLGLAGFLGWLIVSGDYWMYLNPRFKPATAVAAGLLAVLAVLATWRPVSRPSPGRAACYLALALMIGLAEGGRQDFSPTAENDPFAGNPALPALDATQPAGPERTAIAGTTYVPLNVAELFNIAAKGHGPAFDRPYVLRGFVHRSPELDAKGQFVLWRLAVWCCFADATAVGFRVTPPPGQAPPEDQTWLVAYGRLTDAPADEKPYTLPGMTFSSVNPTAVFAAAHLETAVPAPEETSMFEWREGAPYAY
jgi:uncharacterized repeat protein (TIGR03943 family)